MAVRERIRIEEAGAIAAATVFRPAGGAEEAHVMVEAPPGADLRASRLALGAAYRAVLARLGLPPDSAIFRRVFASDLANQTESLRADPTLTHEEPLVAHSLVEQPPLPGRKLALWAWHLKDDAPLARERRGHTLWLRRPGRTHLFSTRLTGDPSAERSASAKQTSALFDRYEDTLGAADADLKNHVLRTWLFVRDVDRNYGGLVEARRELFTQRGLTADTHYIASTGIEGRTGRADDLVTMDAWAVAGLELGQIRYLTAPDNLGPTSAYGVTFERGVTVSWGDRRHVIISGTASIDPAGDVVAVGQIDRQVERTADNIEALLADADASTDDLLMLIVYVRDPADATRCREAAEARFPGVPHVLVHAPVCRPAWLVEIEAIAALPERNEMWPRF